MDGYGTSPRGGNFGQSPQSGPGGGLIMPGNNAPGQSPSAGGGRPSLFIPGQTGSQDRPGSNSVGSGDFAGGEGGGSVVARQFRPPPGFMDAVVEEVDAGMDTQTMLGRLQSGAGKWHDLARLLRPLAKDGIDNQMVSELTGIPPAVQDRWLAASAVYDSLSESPEFSDNKLQFFSQQQGDEQLIEFRFLDRKARTLAAEYAADHQLSVQDCRILARSIKEWDRRPDTREGFERTPQDCLAFKYFRDAGECRGEEEKAEWVDKGLALEGTSHAAREKLERLLGRRDAAPLPQQLMMPSARLTKEELGFLLLPVVGSWGSLQLEQLVAQPPQTVAGGAFGVFRVPTSAAPEQEWVHLPTWQVIADAQTPVAITVADCTSLPAVVAGVQTDAELRKLRGPGLLVVDISSASCSSTDSSQYCITTSPSGLQLQVGGGGVAAVAAVLCLVRPPMQQARSGMFASALM